MKAKASSRKTVIDLKIIPQSCENHIMGWENAERLKIKIKAAPESGKANIELKKYLADCLSISKARIAITKGKTSRLKRIEIEGLKKSEVYAKIGFDVK